MADIKLLGSRASPFSNRVQIALNLKSIGYEFIPRSPGYKSELLLQSNPVYQKIPVLIHYNKPICESLIIVQYIDEEWKSGPPFSPLDPHQRVTARFWGAYYDDKVFPILRDMRLPQGKQAKLELAEKLVEVLILSEQVFDKLSEGKKFFGGDEIGYVDIALGCFLGWIKVSEKLYDVNLIDATRMPNLVRWIEKFLSHDAVKNVIPDTEELLEFAYKYIPGTKPEPTN